MVKNEALKWALAGLSICFVTLCFAAFSERILYREGSELFFTISRFCVLQPHDPNLFRYSDILLQLPSMGLVLLGNKIGENWLWHSNVIGGLMFYLHTFVFLALAFFLLANNLKELWIYPVLAFALGVVPSLTFGVSGTPLGAAVFWPALILIMRGEPKLSHYLMYFGLVAVLSFGHESLILLSLALIGAVLVLRPKNSVFFLLPAGMSFLWLLFSLKHVLAFKHSIASNFEPKKLPANELSLAFNQIANHASAHIFFAATALVFLTLIAMSTWWKRIQPWTGTLLKIILIESLTFFLWTFIRPLTESELLYAFNYRALVIPITVGFSALMVAHLKLKGKFGFSSARRGQVIFAVLLVSALQDFRGTVAWTKLAGAIRSGLNERPNGCSTVSMAELKSQYSNYFPHIIPTSILLQNSNRPAKIISVEPTDRTSDYSEFCTNIEAGYYIYNRVLSKLSDTRFMKFDLLRKAR